MSHLLSSSSSSSSSFDQEDDEDYIDVEVSSYSIFDSLPSITCPNINTREFEFQMSSLSLKDTERTTTNSPADELFYKGKLLPLHLPPRLQMVENLLLQSSNDKEEEEEEFYVTPLATPPSTPFASCYVRQELVPKEYFSEYLADQAAINYDGETSKKLWTRKIKQLIKQSSLLHTKLKTPKSYIKSLFGKSSCSHQSCATTIYEGSAIKAREYRERISKQCLNQVGRSFRMEKNKDRDVQSQHRRSVCIISKRHIKSNKDLVSSTCSSSSSSLSCLSDSNGFSEIQLFKRMNDDESPIQGAIKHCKQSQY